MNIHYDQTRVEYSVSLYAEPASGVHFFVKRNRVSCTLSTPVPFLSTGNFDKIPLRQAVMTADQQKHVSCGNFMTSTKAEAWDVGLGDFKMSRFKAGELEHSPQNVKYRIANQSPAGRSSKRSYQRCRSQDEVDDMSDATELDRKQQEPSKPKQIGDVGSSKKSSVYRPSGFYHTSQLNKDQKVKAPANKDISEDEDSANEYELASEGDQEESHQKPQDIHSKTECIDPSEGYDQINRVFEELKENLFSQIMNKKATRRLDQSTILGDQQLVQNEYYSPAQLFSMAIKSKEASIEVQAYLKTLSGQRITHVAQYLCSNINHLIMDKFGNYVVQLLVEIHKPSRRYLADLSLHHFDYFAEDEYGSRIMQKLAGISSSFCSKALALFEKSFDKLIKSITGSILLTRLIECSQRESDYHFCIYALQMNKEYLKKSSFNRVLATLVSCCSQALVGHLAYSLRNHTWVLMNDKFGNYVLQILAERGATETTEAIKYTCLMNIGVLLTRKYPKFLLIKLLEMEQSSDFCDNVMDAILGLDYDAIRNILDRRESAMLVIMLLSKQTLTLMEQNADTVESLLANDQGRPQSHRKIRLPRPRNV